MYLRVCAAALLSFSLQLSVSGDEPADPLAAVQIAEEAFDTAMESAKQALLTEYQSEIAKQSKAGNFDNVTRITAGLQFFEADGLLMEPELEAQYKIFGKASRNAKDKLLKSYQAVMATLAKEGQLAELQEIQQIIRDRGLVAKLVSLQLSSNPKFFLMHEGYKGYVKEIPAHQKLNATFEMIVGLSTDGIVREGKSQAGIQGKPEEIVSFRAVSVPNYYLAHGNNELHLQVYMEDEAFRQNASFKIKKGLFRPAAVSFEAVNFPDHFLTMTPDGKVRLAKRQATAVFSRAATFTIAGPKFQLWQ